jgi:hypothetical protein
MSTCSRNRSLNAPNLGVPPPIAAPTKNASPEPGLIMSITHRLNTGGSVQALTILDNEYLIAGLQGGRILVSSYPFSPPQTNDKDRHGRSTPTSFFFQSKLTKKGL